MIFTGVIIGELLKKHNKQCIIKLFMLILPRSAQHQNLQRPQRMVGERVLADAEFNSNEIIPAIFSTRSELRPILSVTRQLFIMSELSLVCLISAKVASHSSD